MAVQHGARNDQYAEPGNTNARQRLGTRRRSLNPQSLHVNSHHPLPHNPGGARIALERTMISMISIAAPQCLQT